MPEIRANITAEMVRTAKRMIQDYETTADQLRLLEDAQKSAEENLAKLRDTEIPGRKRAVYPLVLSLLGTILAGFSWYTDLPWFWIIGALLIVFAVIKLVSDVKLLPPGAAERKAAEDILEHKAESASRKRDEMEKTLEIARKRAVSALAALSPSPDFAERALILNLARDAVGLSEDDL